MRRFKSILEELRLNDPGHKGDFFTLSNNHRDETFTKERLDWAIANQ